MFSISGLRLYFPAMEPWVAQSVSLPSCSSGLSAHECGTAHSTNCCLAGSTSCSLACPAPQCAISLAPPVIASPGVISAQLPVSSPPTSLDECVFFNSLVVGLPYSLMFCQFWLCCVFTLLLSFFWWCEEAQCVYLRLHLGQKPKTLLKSV